MLMIYQFPSLLKQMHRVYVLPDLKAYRNCLEIAAKNDCNGWAIFTAVRGDPTM